MSFHVLALLPLIVACCTGGNYRKGVWKPSCVQVRLVAVHRKRRWRHFKGPTSCFRYTAYSDFLADHYFSSRHHQQLAQLWTSAALLLDAPVPDAHWLKYTILRAHPLCLHSLGVEHALELRVSSLQCLSITSRRESCQNVSMKQVSTSYGSASILVCCLRCSQPH